MPKTLVRNALRTLRCTALGGALAPLVGLLSASCAPTHDLADVEAGRESPIVSNRPQTDKNIVAIVRLSRQGLLDSGTRDANGRVTIAPFARTLLLAEQRLFLKALDKLLPGKTEILQTYRLTFNGFAVSLPVNVRDKVAALPGVVSVEAESTFEPPAPADAGSIGPATTGPFATGTSVRFIGAENAHAQGVTGKGVRVGVIDTGIDYTHKMFGGTGTADAYKNNDPAAIEPGSFPTAKVVGGIDLAGSDYDAASAIEAKRHPKPDADPLDEGGHGSHVSGTIAGYGDNVNTYDGVAPDAALYAIKVFGKSGSTGDSVIMAGLEYAADPDGNLDPSDRLDVVNLSLGSGFGSQYALYESVIHSLARAGTVTVCSAGNSGPTPFIVGAPSTAPDAISVAASVDNSAWNWQFSAVSFATSTTPELLVRAYEADFAKPVSQSQGITGALVPAGLAAADFTATEAAAIAGKVALIDRGQVTFYDKIQRAQAAGAIGVVIANNRPGDPNPMGGGQGKTPLTIPAIMVSLDMAKAFKADIAAGNPVTISFYTDKKIEKPEVIDSITDFSSRGPRSIDALIKPEVAAPGLDVVSAAMGKGDQGVKFSGTSMAAPHTTGVVALLRQATPNATPENIKARLMETATPTHVAKTGAPNGVATQGAGRIRVMEALAVPVTLDPPALSLGVVSASGAASFSRVVNLHNDGEAWMRAAFSFDTSPGVTAHGPASEVMIAPHGDAAVTLGFDIDASSAAGFLNEFDGYTHVALRESTDAVDCTPRAVLSLPLLAEVRRGAEVALTSADVSATTLTVALTNPGPKDGEALPFNFIDVAHFSASHRSGACALMTAGYRVRTIAGGPALLDIGVRLANPLSTWDLCDIDVLIDADGDGVPEQELSGTNDTSLTGGSTPGPYRSFLVDAAKVRAIRAKKEQGIAGPGDTYSSAVQDVEEFGSFGFAQVGVVSTDASMLRLTAGGKLRVKIGALSGAQSTIGDNFLGTTRDGDWIDLDPAGGPFQGLPASVGVAAGQAASFAATASTPASLLVLFPDNGAAAGTALVINPSGTANVLH